MQRCVVMGVIVLHRHSKEQLLMYKWEDINLEMREHAPILFSLIHVFLMNHKAEIISISRHGLTMKGSIS